MVMVCSLEPNLIVGHQSLEVKAAYIEQTGGPGNIIHGDLPDPRPSAGQVRVRVGAVSVNPIDTYVRGGMVAAELPMPFVVGSDFAGTVEAVGEGVTEWESGDRVWGANQGGHGRQGTSAELACVGAEWLHAIPEGVSDESAAAAALVGITAHIGRLIHDGKPIRTGTRTPSSAYTQHYSFSLLQWERWPWLHNQPARATHATRRHVLLLRTSTTTLF